MDAIVVNGQVPAAFWTANIRDCARSLGGPLALFLLRYGDKLAFVEFMRGYCHQERLSCPSDSDLNEFWNEWQAALLARLQELNQFPHHQGTA